MNKDQKRKKIKKLTNADKSDAIKRKSFKILPAHDVIVKAMEEARQLNHNYVGTEHLLLGLLKIDQGVAAQSLTNVGVNIEKAREGVKKTLDIAAKKSKPKRP